MATVSTTRKIPEAESMKLDERGLLSGSWRYIVNMTGTPANGDAITALGGVSIAVRDRIAGGVDCWCIGKDVSPHGNDGLSYAVTVNWGQPNSQDDTTAPWTKPALYAGTPQTTQASIEKDVGTGSQILASNGLPFINPVMRDTSSFNFTIKKSYQVGTITAATIASYLHTINNATYRGLAKHAWKCNSWTFATVDGGIKYGLYEDHVIEIGTAPVGFTWDEDILQAGLLQWNGSKYIPITIGAVAVTEPVPLTSSGTPLAHGATPQYLTVQKYSESDFTYFNIT